MKKQVLAVAAAAIAMLGMPNAGWADGRVARALFTTGIEGHEPVGRVEQLARSADQVFFFTELVGMEGRRVVHRWEYRGEMMAEVAFQVEGPRWRVWSSKSLIPRWKGVWRAVVTSASGEVLAEERFVYGAKMTGDK